MQSISKNMNCTLMFIMSNHYGIKCVRNLLQIEPCDDIFEVIFVIMAHCYDMGNTIVNELCIDFYDKESLWSY